jgi:hypothetical protein
MDGIPFISCALPVSNFLVVSDNTLPAVKIK